jgi:hypothetical protein
MGKISMKNRPKAIVVENKNRKIEKIFIPYQTRTYGKNAAYIFVDFRIKRAGSSNYGGRFFWLVAEN